MKSIKTKMVVLILGLVFVSTVLTVGISLFGSINVTDSVVHSLYDEQLVNSENLFRSILDNEFGVFTLASDGQIQDQAGATIDGRFDRLDEFTENTGMVATVFAKSGNDFVRVLTSIKNEKGERAIGTKLDPTGKAYELISSGNSYSGEADILNNKYVTRYELLKDSSKNVVGVIFVGKPIEAINATISEGNNRTIKTVVGTTIFVLLAAMLISYWIGNSIAKPVSVLTGALQKQANLDFSIAVETEVDKYKDRKDEIGTMAKALHSMEENVRSLVNSTIAATEKVASSSAELTDSARHVAISASEVSRTIEEIANGATTQAKDTEHSVVNVQEMGDLIEKDGDHLDELNKAAAQIDKYRNEGFEILNELVEKTQLSNVASGEVYRIILSNKDGAEKIENASGMIQSIADQTNLLALNAAIEAARAGEAGRGFAIVADEIRKLAEQSNKFTNEIKKDIDELKGNSNIAVSTIERVKGIVEAQSVSVDSTKEKFERIAGAIDVTTVAMDKLNQSSRLMTENKNALLDLMQNLSAIAEENAAGTEQAAATMQEQASTINEMSKLNDNLSNISNELHILIKKFKV